jgi:hypothetical protein
MDGCKIMIFILYKFMSMDSRLVVTAFDILKMRGFEKKIWNSKVLNQNKGLKESSLKVV